MKRSNRIITIILSVLMALSACVPLCAVAYAEAAVTGSGTFGKDGDNLTWTLTDDGVLTVSGEGEMEDFDNDANIPPWKALAQNKVLEDLGYDSLDDLKNAYESGTMDYAAYYAEIAAYRSFFTKIVVEEGVRNIGAYAFYGLNAAQIEFPSSSLNSIGEKACASNKLTRISLPDERLHPEKALTFIDKAAFADNDLTEATIPPSVSGMAYNVFDDNENFRKLTMLSGVPMTYMNVPAVNVDLPFGDFESFAAYRDYKAALLLSRYLHDADYYMSELIGVLIHQYNLTEAQARAMCSANAASQRQQEAEKLGISLSDPDAIAAKINSILGTSLTENEIFTTCPAYTIDPELYAAVYPSGNYADNPALWQDYALLTNYLGFFMILTVNPNAILNMIADPQELDNYLSETYTAMAQFGVTASTPADAVNGILAKVNSDLGLTGSDAYTAATAGTIWEIRGDVSGAVKQAALAKFGTDATNIDTEVRWYYSLQSGGTYSAPVIKPAPWFTVAIPCDDDDVDMLESENIALDLIHDPVQHEGQAPTCGAAGWEPYETCTKCDYTSYTPIAPTGNHTWGEWEISQPATYTAAGQKTRECTVCHTPDYGEVPVLEPVASDGDTGISLSFDPSAYEGEVELTVSQVFDGDSFAVVSQLAGSFAPVLYDITTLVNGEAAQPQAPVTVSIPLPAGFDPAHTFIYHVTDDGAMVPVDFEYDADNGTLTFTASHFSVYAVVDQTPVNTGEPSAEEPPAGEPGDQTAEQPAGSPSFFSKIIDFLNKIINIFRNLFNK